MQRWIGWLLFWSLALAQGPQQLLTGHRAPVGAVAFGPGGQLALGADAYILYLTDGRFSRNLSGHADTVRSLDFALDGTLLSASSDTTLRLWNPQNGLLKGVLQGHRDQVWSARISPDGQQVLSGGADGELRLWEAKGPGQSIYMGRGWVYSVGFWPGESLWAAGGQNGVLLWNPTVGRQLPLLSPLSVRALAWGPGGRLAIGDQDGQLQIWDAQGRFIQQWKAHHLAVGALTWHGNRLISGGQDGQIIFWEAGQPLKTLQTASVLSLAVGGNRLLSGHDDGRARLWSLEGELLRSLEPPAASVAALAYSPDGRLLASGGWEGEVWLWNRQGRPVRWLTEATLEITALAFSPDGEHLAAGSRDGLTRIYQTASGRLVQSLEAHGNGVGALAFAPNGRALATGGRDRLIRVWDWAKGQKVLEFRAHESHLTGLAWSPDGRTLYSSSADESLAWWGLRPEGVKLERRIMAHSRGIYGLALSPGGGLLATASHDQTLKLWEARSGRLLRTLAGHTEAAQALAFSPDGQRLASVGWDKTLRLWSVQGRLLQTTSGFVRPLYAVAWARDGRLAVGGGTLRQAGTIALFRP